MHLSPNGNLGPSPLELQIDHRTWLAQKEARQVLDPEAMQRGAIDRNEHISKLQLCAFYTAGYLPTSIEQLGQLGLLVLYSQAADDCE